MQDLHTTLDASPAALFGSDTGTLAQGFVGSSTTLAEMPSGLCRQRYDVDFVSTIFNMSMWEAIALIRSTDVFLGMHGAGFANLLAIHQVSLQGWGLQDQY